MLCHHFSLEAVLQDMAKNNPTEEQIGVKIINRSLSLQITRIDLHHKLQLLIRICFLLDYRLLFLRFLLLTLSMCLFAGKDIAEKLLLF